MRPAQGLESLAPHSKVGYSVRSYGNRCCEENGLCCSIPQPRRRTVLLVSGQGRIEKIPPIHLNPKTLRRAIEHLRPLSPGVFVPSGPNIRFMSHDALINSHSGYTGGDSWTNPFNARTICQKVEAVCSELDDEKRIEASEHVVPGIAPFRQEFVRDETVKTRPKAPTLTTLLQQGEWSTTEFKAARDALPKSSFETISAFANTRGGWLLLGVSQSG